MHSTIGATPNETAWIHRVIDQANRASRDYFAATTSLITTPRGEWPTPPTPEPGVKRGELHRFTEGGFIGL